MWPNTVHQLDGTTENTCPVTSLDQLSLLAMQIDLAQDLRR
ncbi:hypothetical protein [Streptomyces sp. NPDC056549]